jgi:hypothetical protein
VKRTVAYALIVCLGLALSFPSPVRADENSARTAVQKHNAKQSRKDMKRMRKEQKKMRKPQLRLRNLDSIWCRSWCWKIPFKRIVEAMDLTPK